jgi:hypothetical protein
MFAFDNSGDIEVKWRTKDGDMSKTDERKKTGMRKAHGVGVALAATARVRQSLWNGIRESGAIYCDTDGLIAPSNARVSPVAAGEGTWHPKLAFPVLDVKAPQLYRWVSARDFQEWADGIPDSAWNYLGESSPKNFLGGSTQKQIHGDDLGTAGAMSVRQAHVRGLMK